MRLRSYLKEIKLNKLNYKNKCQEDKRLNELKPIQYQSTKLSSNQ